jgi:hypothetical protein
MYLRRNNIIEVVSEKKLKGSKNQITTLFYNGVRKNESSVAAVAFAVVVVVHCGGYGN